MGLFLRILLIVVCLVELIEAGEKSKGKDKSGKKDKKGKGGDESGDGGKVTPPVEKLSYMTLYDDNEDSAGEMRVNVTDFVPDLNTLNFGDRTTRVQVFGDTSFELYEHPNYNGGRMVVTPGARINAHVNNGYSSARKICTYDDRPESAKIIIYEHANSQGDSIEFYGAIPDLRKIRMSNPQRNWGDQLSSSWAVKGDWELYDHPNFEGQRWLTLEGEANNMGSGLFWSDHDRISSLRPICDTYKPVVECTPYKVEILESDKLKPTLEGVEVIGSQSGGTCSATGTHTMTLSNTDSVTETVSLETANSETWSTSSSNTFSVDLIGAPWGVGAAIGMSWTSTTENSLTLSSSETKSFSKGNEKSASQSVTYSAPGAALIFGIVERYVYDKSQTPTRTYLKCTDGTKKTEDGTMALRSVTFPSVNFWTWSGKFNEKSCKNDPHIPECVDDVRRKYLKMDDETKKRNVQRDWEKCFDGGKGIAKII